MVHGKAGPGASASPAIVQRLIRGAMLRSRVPHTSPQLPGDVSFCSHAFWVMEKSGARAKGDVKVLRVDGCQLSVTPDLDINTDSAKPAS